LGGTPGSVSEWVNVEGEAECDWASIKTTIARNNQPAIDIVRCRCASRHLSMMIYEPTVVWPARELAPSSLSFVTARTD
jgi:hypothetical protein